MATPNQSKVLNKASWLLLHQEAVFGVVPVILQNEVLNKLKYYIKDKKTYSTENILVFQVKSG